MGFAAIASTANLNVIQQPPAPPGAAASRAPVPSPAAAIDPLWDHQPATWLRDLSLMSLLGLVFSVLTWWRLARLRPGRRG